MAGLLAAAGLLATQLTHAAFFTPGQFDVTPTGAASYTVPIAIPPGTAGMAPSLALAYNSQGGNGLLGVGWSLSGLSAVTRCPKTLVQDGIKSGIQYDATDKYCLDGQRLVVVSGTYGANGAEYRTEREGFSKIVSYGSNGYGPTWFKVWTKSGQIMEFGNTTDSAIEAQGKSAIRVWAVNKIADTKGNYLTVTYTEDNPNGQYYPQRIDYTGNANAGLTPYSSVRFTYVARPDITPQYDGGSLIKNTTRLTNVQTYAKVSGVDTMVKDYRLSYDTSAATQRSRLVGMQECDGTGANCLSSTALSMSDGSQSTVFNSFTGLSTTPLQLSNNTMGFQPGDFNGDGKTDILRWSDTASSNAAFLSNGDGSFTQAAGFNLTGTSLQLSNNTIGFRLGDFNGDGRMDILRWGMSSSNNALFISNGSGGFNQSASFNLVELRMAIPATGTTIRQVVSTWRLPADDTCFLTYFCPAGSTPFAPYAPYAKVVVVSGSGGKGTICGLECDVTTYTCPSGYTLSGSNCIPDVNVALQLVSSTMGFQLGDVNGDGRMDIVRWSDTPANNAVFLSNGDGSFMQATAFNLNGSNLQHSNNTIGFHLGDFNGDGRTDILRWSDTVSSNAVFLSNGDGSFTQAASFNLTGSNLQHSNNTIGFQLGDFNGDGRTDILRRGDTASNNAVFLSKGDGSFTQAAAFNLTGSNLQHSNNTIGFQLGDFNSDGRTDILRWSDTVSSNAVFLSNGDGSFTQAAGFNLTGSNLQHSNNTIGFQLGDFNGDGRTDIMRRGDNYANNTLFATLAPLPDYLATITNGLNAITSIAYKSITDATVYTRDATGVYPVVDIQAPLYVVSSVSSSNGIGGTYTSTYSYVGAKSHVTGGGFLGFRQTVSTDTQTGIKSTTTYRQDYPYQSLPTAAEKRTSGNALLNSVINAWAFDANPGWSAQYHVPKLTQSVESSYELTGALISTVTTGTTYDGYGNPTQITVSTGDGYSKTTVNTYTNDTANWYLGRLTGATVTSTTP